MKAALWLCMCHHFFTTPGANHRRMSCDGGPMIPCFSGPLCARFAGVFVDVPTCSGSCDSLLHLCAASSTLLWSNEGDRNVAALGSRYSSVRNSATTFPFDAVQAVETSLASNFLFSADVFCTAFHAAKSRECFARYRAQECVSIHCTQLVHPAG